MYTEINDDERDQIYNKEPSKCKGWFWTNIEQCKEYKAGTEGNQEGV